MVVVALAVSWWVNNARWTRTNRKLELSLLELRANILQDAIPNPLELPQYETEFSSLLLLHQQLRPDELEAALANQPESPERDSTQQPGRGNDAD